jgi:hypothetical protein
MTAAVAPLGCRTEKGKMKSIKVLALRSRFLRRPAEKSIYTKYLTLLSRLTSPVMRLS